jgi:hypothetical protein
MLRPILMSLAAAAALTLAAAGAPAQVATVDPNAAVGPAPRAEAAEAEAGFEAEELEYQPIETSNPDVVDTSAEPAGPTTASQRASRASTSVKQRDVFSAAEGVFGKGAEGLADLIEDVLRERGDPSGYITGREAGGAFIAGVRYGSGTLHHSIEGDRKVYWTGPSVGFDFGGNADKVFVLVYNLNDSERLFRRFPAGEGKAYVVGGFTASYLRRGDVVLIPVRLGVGARLGINAGYMRFSQKSRLLPF